MGSPSQNGIQNVYVVFNPVAGVQKPETTRQLFEERFESAGVQYEIYETTGDESVPEIVRAAVRNKAGMVIAAGGDGTVSGVAAGLVGSKVPMAIVPAGTGNSMARELGVPLDFGPALELAMGEHQVRAIDGMQVGEDLFLLNVSVGLSARTMRMTRREQKRRFGNLAYVWNIAQQLTGVPLRRFDLKIDGRDVRIIASELMILNCGMIGVQRLPEDLEVCPDDGQVDIYVVRARSARDYMSVFWNLLVGKKESHPKLQSLSAQKTIAIKTRRPLSVQADGEVIGKTPVQVKVLSHAVNIIVPCPEPAVQPESEGKASQEQP